LAFVIYPTAVLTLPGSPFWAILFFIMLITLGLDTQFTLVETAATTIFDAFPNLIKKKHLITLGLCVGFFLSGESADRHIEKWISCNEWAYAPLSVERWLLNWHCLSVLSVIINP